MDRKLSVAPMMEWTDSHYRYFARLISRHTLLYTEMVTTGALIHGDRERFLGYDPAEHPVALQLGGSDPAELAQCARMGADWGYDEINLNVGCPSDRVQNGRFGACLMAEPALVADCVAAMKAAVTIPVTVKSRIGIDHQDSYPELVAFTEAVAAAGCDALIVHARKAWLSGLSPRENREVPPLRWDWVVALKQNFPRLPIVLNGGVTTLTQVEEWLPSLNGVMIGREAYQNPWVLADADRRLFGAPNPVSTPEYLLSAFRPYVQRQLAAGVPLAAMTRHLLGLFLGRPGAKAWRRTLSERAHRPGAGIEVLDAAAQCVLTPIPVAIPAPSQALENAASEVEAEADRRVAID
ncbi:tRNA dihydrouridine(20/20a) synthase DusA [Halochromatium glycolicum]|uniref:tRNA-dihydrouridine(20/20a) synthase n=1 Tax=Halochromatium glycolicum TaxID=85075 RepID=A0AAJ0U4Z9_9GAMM|nr:tRNA dihydrouridine(20/20a) synthase DusA [Halochromatium glycolicum]MBK1705346.1 tRNA dihydrouridine(20/20a) synthase DusA [Halochromatium glycolicum]